MRVKLFNPRGFFKQIFEKQNTNLSDLSKLIKVNYSNLKNYRRGELTIPEETFYVLLNYSSNKSYWKRNIRIINNNWGQRKGGLVSSQINDVHKRLLHARQFKKITRVKISPNEVFCEFYGALLGDGCITKYKVKDGTIKIIIILSANKKLDSEYLKYLKDLLNKEYGLYSYYYENKKANVCTLTVRNKQFCVDLNKNFDVPIGLKYSKIRISNYIADLPWSIKKFVIRGLFDTDGIIFARKDEEYKYPHISITSKSRYFLGQIKNMLREQGYPAYINGNDVRIKGIGNVKRWFLDIGSSNSRNLRKYEYFLKHGYVPNQSLGL